MLKYLYIIALCFSSFITIGQTIQIRGSIYAAQSNEALAGASIVAVNSALAPTLVGTFSEADGSFVLDINKDSITAIEVSYIGYQTKIIALTNAQMYTITLVADAVNIQTVVVTVPYGKLKKETFTGAMSLVKAEQITGSTESTFEKALQGQISGVVLSSPSGQPGASSQIQLRGAGSISAASEPLIVLDGIPMFSGQTTQYSTNSSILASINPHDIESISILKDASATSLYGSRASNGVIMITTKQGKHNSATKYAFSTSQGLGQIYTNNFRVLNSAEYKEVQVEAMKNAGRSDEDISTFLSNASSNVDWFHEVYRPAWYQNYEFSAQGGDAQTNFFLSTSYKNEEGIVKGTDLQRYSIRLNISNKASKKIIFGLKLNPTFAKQNITDAPGVLSSPVTGAFIAAPTTPIYLNNSYNFSEGFFNPAGMIALNQNWNNSKRLPAQAFFQFKFTPNLEFNSIGNIDYLYIKEFVYRHPQTPDGAIINGLIETFFTDITTITSSNTMRYTKQVKNTHAFDVLGGIEIENAIRNQANMKASNFPVENLQSIYTASKMEGMNTSTTEHALLSALSNFQYNYKSTYFASASFRIDGSSKFSPTHRWAPFWSVGGSWLIHNETFLRKYNFLSLAKLRASFGTSGNANIEDYAYMQLYEFGNNYDSEPGSTPKQMGNDKLTWEKNNNANIGLDIGINKRIETSLDVYHRKTYDLLLLVPVSMTSGYTHQLQNVGAMVNKGVEMQIQSQVLKKATFSWFSTVTFSKNINSITELYSPNSKDTIIQGTKIRTEGESLQSFYLAEWAGVNSADGSPMWYDTEGNLTKNYDNARKILAGTADPKFIVGWNNRITYKAWNLDFLWYWNHGNLIFNQLQTELVSDGALSGKNMSSQALDYWKEPGDIAANPKLIQNNGSNSNKFSTRYLENGSYLRLKQVQLSYALPTENLTKWHIQTCTIYLQAQNLWVLSQFSGLDPETRNTGVYYFDYPKQRLFTGGLSLHF